MLCESYGLVFGVNSFIALCLQSLLTVVITDERGLGLKVRQQVLENLNLILKFYFFKYLIYGFMHFVIALIFLLSVIFTVVGYFYRNCVTKRTRYSF